VTSVPLVTSVVKFLNLKGTTQTLSKSQPKKRKRPQLVRVAGRSSNSPPPKSAQEELYFLFPSRGIARKCDYYSTNW
jgi:hypothetical protein